MGPPNSGRLWDLAALACRLAEVDEEERRKRKGKAVALFDVGSCSTSGATKIAGVRSDSEIMGDQPLSPPDKKRKVHLLSEEEGGVVMGPESGRLWELATLACRLAEEEEEEERRRRKGKAVDVGSCSTSSAAKVADGEEEETERKKRKGKAEGHPSVPKNSQSPF